MMTPCQHRCGDCADAQIEEGVTMYIRNIAVVGSFAVSAALALAPLASADDELTPVVEIEISLLNSLFVSDAGLAESQQ